ncbi:MAG TPA: DUF1810 domain-containing protein [Motilibacteraceae bacterium]|nr:DUF1810 domain-containing protein [Motilibacteraceae bacterium]
MDEFDLQRFLDAQDDGTYADALAELRAGRKRSHWMWFVFPQLRGLGHSPTSVHFGITGLPEAAAYLAHPVLGPRLLECCRALLDLPADDPEAVLGSIDALKLHSSVTLFAAAAPDQSVFADVLARYFQGRSDEQTVRLLDGHGGPR